MPGSYWRPAPRLVAAAAIFLCACVSRGSEPIALPGELFAGTAPANLASAAEPGAFAISPMDSGISAPSQSFDQLLHRLDQQEEELRRLREQIEQMQPAGSGKTDADDKALTAKWNYGLELKNKSGDFRMHIGALMQYDISWLNPEPFLEVSPAIGGIGPDPNSTQIHRARVRIDGTVYENFDFMFEYDFANFLTPASPTAGQPVVASPAPTEMWLQWSHIPLIGAIRAGNQKEALGLEHLEAIKDISFLEPSYLFDMLFGPFNNGFNPGISILNSTEDQRLTWEIGVWGNNSDAFGYSINNDWALSGRTTYLLFYDEPSQGRYLWEIGTSGSLRQPDEGVVRLRDRGNIRSGPPGVLNPLYADTGAMQADQQNIVAVETFAQYGPWSLQAEYGGTWVDGAVQPFAPSAPVAHGTPYFHGGYIETWYFLTGENRTYNKQLAAPARTIPYENAYWLRDCSGECCHGIGAWQVGVRYSAVDLNDNGINGGILNSGTVGLNWFLNPNAVVQFNYDLTHRSQVQSVAPGFINSFGTRIAYNF